MSCNVIGWMVKKSDDGGDRVGVETKTANGFRQVISPGNRFLRRRRRHLLVTAPQPRDTMSSLSVWLGLPRNDRSITEITRRKRHPEAVTVPDQRNPDE